MKWGHDQLQNDLAAHLRATSDRVIWTDMQLGPSGSPRPDVYSIPKSYSRFVPVAYEIKISVADFRRDVTSGKWQKYLKYAAGVVFAVPKGLITKADIPTGCGLMVRGEEGWHTVKGPTLAPVQDLPREMWLKLVIDGIERASNPLPQARQAIPWIVQQAIRKKYGEEIAQALAARDGAVSQLDVQRQMYERRLQELADRYQKDREQMASRAKSEAPEVDAARAALCEALGLELEASIWDIKHEAKRVAKALQRDEELSRLNGQIKLMQDHLQRAMQSIKSEMPALLSDAGEVQA